MSSVPPWHALLAELACASFDPVVTPPRPSSAWLWALWLIPTGLLFVPVLLWLTGRSLPAAITDAFPWIVLPILLGAGAITFVLQARALRAHNADLALFGFTSRDPISLTARVTGQYQLTGRRWGRSVAVVLERPTRRIGPSVVRVGAPSPRFELQGQGAQLVAQQGAPAPLLGLLATVTPSGPWDGVTVTAGPEGITVRRPATWIPVPDIERERRWLYDLWLAERLAAALATPPATPG